MKLELADFYAHEVKSMLAPFTERIEICGGVRRRKEEPHDIEVIAIPRFESRGEVLEAEGNALLMPAELPRVNLLDEAIHQLLDETKSFRRGEPDKAGKKAPCGDRYYRLNYKGEKLDVFSVFPPAQWGYEYLIRTGPADFSREFVTRLWAFGLKGNSGHVEQMNNGKVWSTPEEEDCFRLVDVPYVAPEQRCITSLYMKTEVAKA